MVKQKILEFQEQFREEFQKPLTGVESEQVEEFVNKRLNKIFKDIYNFGNSSRAWFLSDDLENNVLNWLVEIIGLYALVYCWARSIQRRIAKEKMPEDGREMEEVIRKMEEVLAQMNLDVKRLCSKGGGSQDDRPSQ
jgi:hypothetical protein